MGYYMGDPGFFSIIKALGSSALGLVPGGGVAGKVLGGASRISTIARKAGGTILRHPVISAAGGAATIGLAGAGLGRMGMHAGAMKGFHINKHGKMVRNRRMRVTNPKALGSREKFCRSRRPASTRGTCTSERRRPVSDVPLM